MANTCKRTAGMTGGNNLYMQTDPLDMVPGHLDGYQYADARPTVLTDQTGLDTAGCDIVGGAYGNSTCRLQCCAAHDACYDRNHCGSFDKSCNTPNCNECDNEVLRCTMRCFLNPAGDPLKPRYYCAKQHRYVAIPGDFPDIGTAEKQCEHDYTGDCKGKPKPNPRPKPDFAPRFP